MKISPLHLILGVGAAAALGLYSSKPYAQEGQIVDIKAGETWQITMKAVGATMTQERIDLIKKGMEAMGYAGITIVPNAAMTEAVMTLKSPMNDKIILNKLMPNPVDPSKGILYSAAVKIS